jgi:hypothetical protein
MVDNGNEELRAERGTHRMVDAELLSTPVIHQAMDRPVSYDENSWLDVEDELEKALTEGHEVSPAKPNPEAAGRRNQMTASTGSWAADRGSQMSAAPGSARGSDRISLLPGMCDSMPHQHLTNPKSQRIHSANVSPVFVCVWLLYALLASLRHPHSLCMVESVYFDIVGVLRWYACFMCALALLRMTSRCPSAVNTSRQIEKCCQQNGDPTRVSGLHRRCTVFLAISCAEEINVQWQAKNGGALEKREAVGASRLY